jgi:hypothetical protein
MFIRRSGTQAAMAHKKTARQMQPRCPENKWGLSPGVCRLFRGIAQSHLHALMDAALITRRRAAFDITFARSPIDQRKSAVHDRLQVARLFGRERTAHGADLVAESGPRETIKCSAPLGLTDPLKRLNTICHLLLCILLIEFDLSE